MYGIEKRGIVQLFSELLLSTVIFVILYACAEDENVSQEIT